MRRTLVQLDEDTYRSLRERAFRQERSLSSLVRELLAQGLRARAAPERPRRAAEFASVGAGRSRDRGRAAVSERHDEALAAAFRK